MKNNRYRYFVQENKDLTYTVYIYDLNNTAFSNSNIFSNKLIPRQESYFSLTGVLKRLDILDQDKNKLEDIWPMFYSDMNEDFIIDNEDGNRCYNLEKMGKRSREFFGNQQSARAELK